MILTYRTAMEYNTSYREDVTEKSAPEVTKIGRLQSWEALIDGVAVSWETSVMGHIREDEIMCV